MATLLSDDADINNLSRRNILSWHIGPRKRGGIMGWSWLEMSVLRLVECVWLV